MQLEDLKIFVKPKQGLVIRDPMTKYPIASEGMDVPENSYWLRRLKSGDVVLVSNVQIPDVIVTRSESKFSKSRKALENVKPTVEKDTDKGD